LGGVGEVNVEGETRGDWGPVICAPGPTTRAGSGEKWRCKARTELAKIYRLARIIAMKSLGGSGSLKFLLKKGISGIGRKPADDDAGATCLGGVEVGKLVVLFRATGPRKPGAGPAFDGESAYHVV
jgi:hypothetical protein